MTETPAPEIPDTSEPPEPDPPGTSAATDRLLTAARARISTVDAEEAFRLQGGGATLVDTRPAAQRAEHGEIAGAVVIERNVLEWRLDPASPDRLPEVTGYDLEILVLCNEGYSSSLVADTLRTLGLARTVDVIGGFVAWTAAGLPTTGGHASEAAA